MRRVQLEEIKLKPFTVLNREWALLVAGREQPNPMTVSWGGLGTLWDRPVVTAYVRPTRFTFSLLEALPEFTLNVLGEPHRKALDMCGTWSGRNTDKWRKTGLAQVPSETVSAPGWPRPSWL